MADTETQKDAWRQTTDSLRNDLEIPMDIIATQSQTLVKNWMNGFSQMMFDGVTYNKNGVVDFSKELTPRMMQVSYSALENGVVAQKKIEMPLLGVVQYPAMELDTINLKLNYSVDTTNESKNNSSMENTAGADVNGSFLGFGAKVGYSFKMTQTEERTRKTDTRASLTVDANYSRLPQGEAISRLADVLMNNAIATDTTKTDG